MLMLLVSDQAVLRCVTSEQNNSQHLFGACCRSKLNLPASIEAVCDLLEEVVKLRPSLVQVRLKSLYVKQSCYVLCFM